MRGRVVCRGEGTFKNDVRDRSDPNDDQMECRDDSTSDQDGTPGCRLMAREGNADGQGGTLIVWDTAAGDRTAFEIVIAI